MFNFDVNELRIRGNTKTMLLAIALILAMATPLIALPTANAQITKKTFAFIGATPNPIGVDQETLLHIGITDPTSATEQGWEGLTVTVTRPDGTTETLGPYRTDATGGTGDIYVPTMEGTYYLQTHFPEQEMPEPGYARGNIAAGTVMLASDSEKLALVVQAEPVPIYPGNPLPTEYWTRPINAQLREWSVIAGNWLVTDPLSNYFAPYNDGPETAHILWAKPLEIGGLGGGELGPHSFEDGAAYESKFEDSVIINGILYYNRFPANGQTAVEQEVVAVDLHTGEELWVRNWNNTRLAFGQTFYWDSYNYHGIFAYLWTEVGSTWNAYDAQTGRWVYSMTNVPSGYNRYGPKGEIYRYTVDLENGWMTLWNSSRVGSSEGSWASEVVGRTLDTRNGIEWNKTIPTGLASGARIWNAVLEDRIIGSNLSGNGRGTAGVDPVYLWGISTAPGQEGVLLFNTTWKPPAGGLFLNLAAASLEDGVFVIAAKEIRAYFGFSLDTGKLLWGPTESQHYLMHNDLMLTMRFPYVAIAYGKLFSTGTSGIVYAYNVTTGALLWTYNATDPYNEILWSNNWPLYMAFITDGKIYLRHGEHSPIDPKPRGGPLICIDAETGAEIWRLPLYASSFTEGGPIIGDSIIALISVYDNRIYSIGKGPSATTVSAAPKVSVHGDSVLVEGMVTDISPGTEEYALTARFPDGVPAVSDANMSDWMQYVYLQLPRPTDVTGVDVVVEVFDPNNNCYEVGRTTSDDSGFYKLMFEPDVPGEYTVIARFAGSEAYYGSFAKTAVSVLEAPTPTAEPTPEPAPMTDTYVLGLGIAAIIAIVIVGLVIILMLRKR